MGSRRSTDGQGIRVSRKRTGRAAVVQHVGRHNCRGE
jgi:hypothetical protein